MTDNGDGHVTPSRPNLKDVIAAEIRELVFSGQLRPGQKVDQTGLSEALGVSRIPIREALIGLEREGLVRNVARRGAFVAPLSREDIRDHFEIYGQLAALASRRAAINIVDEDLERLEVILEKMEASTADLDAMNDEFHRIINRACASPRLMAVLRLLSESMPARFFENSPEWSSDAQADHRRMLDALRSRDPDASGEATLEHFRTSGHQAASMLEAQGFWSAEDSVPGG